MNRDDNNQLIAANNVHQLLGMLHDWAEEQHWPIAGVTDFEVGERLESIPNSVGKQIWIRGSHDWMFCGLFTPVEVDKKRTG